MPPLPNLLIATVASVLSEHYFSHSKIDNLFTRCHATGPAPPGNLVDKMTTWLGQSDNPFSLLGCVLENFMEMETQEPKEAINPGTELCLGHPMPLELKEERAGMRLKLRFSKWSQYEDRKCLSIEKPCIRLPGLESIPGLSRIGRDGQFLPYLEAHFKIFRNLPEIVA